IIGQCVNDAQLECTSRRNVCAGCNRFESRLWPRQTGEALGSAPAGDQTELDFGQADSGPLRSDPPMAREGKLQPATEGGALDRCDDRLGCRLHLHLYLARARSFQSEPGSDLVEVRAGGKAAR